MGKKLKLIPLALSVFLFATSCTTNIMLHLQPQVLQDQSCQPHPEFQSFKVKKIAVLPFEDSAKQQSQKFVPHPKFRIRSYDVYSHLPDDGSFTGAVAERFLLTSYKYNVVERQELKRILQEQKLNMIGLIDSRDAVEIGKLAGADALLMGKVIKAYAHFDHRTQTDGSFIGTYIGYAVIEMRLVHVETGKILFSCLLSRTSLNYLDKPISVSNHEIIREPHRLDAALHGADAAQRTKYVIEQAVKEALQNILSEKTCS